MADQKHEIKVKVDYGDGKPVWFKIPYTSGDPIFIINDPDQREYLFIGFSYVGENLRYELSYLGEEINVLAIVTTPIKDFTKSGSSKKDDE